MPRAPSHVNETIASRAFEHALHPNLLTHAVRQGADYGIDYWGNAFGDDGELDRTFAVQVKYVDPNDVTYTSLVAANDEDFFCTWLSDLHAYGRRGISDGYGRGGRRFRSA